MTLTPDMIREAVAGIRAAEMERKPYPLDPAFFFWTRDPLEVPTIVPERALEIQGVRAAIAEGHARQRRSRERFETSR